MSSWRNKKIITWISPYFWSSDIKNTVQRFYCLLPAQWLLCDLRAVGLILGWVIPKTLKMLIVGRLALSIKKVDMGIRTGHPSGSIMRLDGISVRCLGCDISVRQHSCKWVFSSVPHTDIVVIWLKDCKKWCKTRIKQNFMVFLLDKSGEKQKWRR